MRQLKTKLAKSESREKRRTQSLKGRESFQLSKEVEEKLIALEAKMATIITNAGSYPSVAPSTASAAAAADTKGKINSHTQLNWFDSINLIQ